MTIDICCSYDILSELRCRRIKMIHLILGGHFCFEKAAQLSWEWHYTLQTNGVSNGLKIPSFFVSPSPPPIREIRLQPAVNIPTDLSPTLRTVHTSKAVSPLSAVMLPGESSSSILVVVAARSSDIWRDKSKLPARLKEPSLFLG